MPAVDTCSLLPFPELSDESGMKKSTPIRCSLAYFLRSPPRVMLPSFHVYPFTFSCVVFQALSRQFLRVKSLNASYWKWRRHSSTSRSFLLSSRAFSVTGMGRRLDRLQCRLHKLTLPSRLRTGSATVGTYIPSLS